MGKAKNGINGTVTGKVGYNVFYMLNGENIIRSLPEIGSIKPTPGRLRQRQRLSLVASFLRPFRELIRITFAHVSKKRQPYHIAQSLNMKNCIKGDVYPDQEIDLAKTILSTGSLELPTVASVKRTDTGLNFEWEVPTIYSSDNLVVIVNLNQSHGVEYQFTAIPKSNGIYHWDIDLPDNEVSVWMAFRSNDQQDMSNSIYLGDV